MGKLNFIFLFILTYLFQNIFLFQKNPKTLNQICFYQLFNRNIAMHMGLTKTTLFTAQQNRLAEITKALGHPARIAILQHLLNVKGCVCGDLVDVLPLSQSTVSQHLKALKQAGIIHGDIEGVKTCYCINPKVWGEIKMSLGSFFDDYGDCC